MGDKKVPTGYWVTNLLLNITIGVSVDTKNREKQNP
jgi:hypothetical protein